MGEITLDYAVPDADLSEFVSSFYHFRADVPWFEDVERADRAQFRFRLSPGEGHYRFADGTVQPIPAVAILGPTTGPCHASIEGPIHAFGAGLHPAGWAALMQVDASTLVDRVIDAETLLGPGVNATAHLLREAGTTEAMVAIVTDLARQVIGGIDRSRFAFVHAVDDWLAGSISPDMEDLVAATGLSRRQLERKCKAFYGVPPKLLQRKYRALRAAHAIANGAHPIDLLDRGFYDQSHLIREVKHFAGVTPKQMHERPSSLTELTIRGRSELAGRVSALVSET